MPAEAVSDDPVVIVVDLMEFRRALVVRFLQDWSLTENVELLSFVPEDAHRELRKGIKCRMITFNAGSSSGSSVATLSEITVLRALAPSAPLIVPAEEEFPEDVVAVVQCGAEGYVSNHSAPDLVLSALSFVLKGGTYVPRSTVTHACFANEEPLNGDHEAHDVLIHDADGEEMDGNQTLLTAAPLSPFSLLLELSERQKAILEGLCRGEPNKVIGRVLDLPESTVKVHVREIMRKLGVSNRTQVAVAACRMGVVLNERQLMRGGRQGEELPVVDHGARVPLNPELAKLTEARNSVATTPSTTTATASAPRSTVRPPGHSLPRLSPARRHNDLAALSIDPT